jgi:dTDP-4-amino-4,6-dideoxygalactose transaminase
VPAPGPQLTVRAANTDPLPLIDLRREYDRIRHRACAAFDKLAADGDFTLGAELQAFEAEFAEFCGVAACAGVADGTDALRLALLALGARPGTEVVTVALSFVATAEAIAMTGARPTFVDVDPATRLMDPDALRAAISPSTVAVVPVHLYGRPAPMGEIAAICAAAGVPVVEDAAQAHGASVSGRRVGAWGAAASFSFYPTKNLGAMGDGGAVVSDDPGVIAAVRSLRHHGCHPAEANRHVRVGSTSRLDNLQAAILRLKLPDLDACNARRRRAARLYRDALQDLPLVLPPDDPPDGRQVVHLYAVELDDRDRVLSGLRQRGIGASVHYPTPIHLQPAWADCRFGPGALPATEAVTRRTLSLPLFPGITEGEIARVATALRAVL